MGRTGNEPRLQVGYAVQAGYPISTDNDSKTLRVFDNENEFLTAADYLIGAHLQPASKNTYLSMNLNSLTTKPLSWVSRLILSLSWVPFIQPLSMTDSPKTRTPARLMHQSWNQPRRSWPDVFA